MAPPSFTVPPHLFDPLITNSNLQERWRNGIEVADGFNRECTLRNTNSPTGVHRSPRIDSWSLTVLEQLSNTAPVALFKAIAIYSPHRDIVRIASCFTWRSRTAVKVFARRSFTASISSALGSIPSLAFAMIARALSLALARLIIGHFPSVMRCCFPASGLPQCSRQPRRARGI